VVVAAAEGAACERWRGHGDSVLQTCNLINRRAKSNLPFRVGNHGAIACKAGTPQPFRPPLHFPEKMSSLHPFD
jgi:hypothetical protein